MNNKENDLFLNMLYNPDMTLQDFQSVGLTADNTGIDNIESYKNNKKVRETFITETGQFNEKEFEQAYVNAKKIYNIFTNMNEDEEIIKNGNFHRDNIFAPKQTLRHGPDVGTPTKIFNPMRQQGSISTLGKLEAPTLSVSEIAQQQEVYDPATDTWSAAPNDTFAGLPYLFDTLVLATWDENGTHKDPITGDIVKHEIGDPKLNDQGTYYYEKLNGRPVYNKQVLNKLDILTPEGSKINKYDFFDSDGVEQKSITGNILKNASLIAPMFIPYVGPWITGANIIISSLGWMSTLGKMFLGSDSPTLSNIEGWSRSMDKSEAKSTYAQENTFCWENMIDLIGDTVSFLRESRFLFKYAPSVFKGSSGISTDATKAYQENLTKQFIKEGQEKLNQFVQSKSQSLLSGGFDYLAEQSYINTAAASKASKLVEDYIKSYNKIGSIISKTYMTADISSHMYGEAKNAGASDLDATLLTLGYSAALATFFNTGVAEHIMPELKEGARHQKALLNAVMQIKNKSVVDKKSYAKDVFNIGKKLFQDGIAADTGVTSELGKSIFAHSIASGIENTGMEVLGDLARGCYNLSQWLRGNDSKLEISNLSDRYTMGFIGGAVGGGINAPFMGYKSYKQNKNINSKQAVQEIIYMIRNGNIDDFLKTVKKSNIASKNLSTRFTTDEKGNQIFDTAKNYEDSQDYEAKQIIYNTIDNIKKIINAEGGEITDSQFLDKQTLGDLRFNELQKSITAGKYLQDYQDVLNGIYDTINEIDKLNDSDLTDRQKLKQEKEETQDLSTSTRKKELEAKLTDLRKQKDELVNGDRAKDFIGSSLYEMIPAINTAFIKTNFIQYAEKVEQKAYSDIPRDRLQEIYKQYENWLATDGKNEIFESYTKFKDLLTKASPIIKQMLEANIDGVKNKEIENILRNLRLYTENPEVEDLENVKYALDNDAILRNILNVKEGDSEENVAIKLNDFITNLQSEIDEKGFIDSEYKKLLLEQLTAYQTKFADFLDENYSNEYDDFYDKISQFKTYLSQANESPVLKLLYDFSFKINNTELNVNEIINSLNDTFTHKLENIQEFVLDKNLNSQADYALKTIEILKSLIHSYKTDNVGLGTTIKNKVITNNSDYWGYTKTLNELSDSKNTDKLAEIDTKQANILLQDLENIENKIKLLLNISSINNSQKLNRQFNIDLNQAYIFRNKLKQFISVIPNAWIGKSDLEKLINSDNFNKYSDKKDFNLDDKTRIEVKKDFLALQDGIYDFFQKNKDKDLSEIINPNTLSLLTRDYKLLNENTSDIEDQSFIWYLASRAALKASDFYSKYKDSIIDNLAPIIPQELAIYNTFAFLTNNNVFSNFINAYNKGLKQYFKSLSDDDLNSIKIKLQLPKSFTKEQIIDNVQNFELTPNYKRISLVEGIAGAGKTTLMKQIVNMIKSIPNQKLLDNVIISHGASEESAKQFAKNLGFKDSQAKSREDLMKYISNDWTNDQENLSKSDVEQDEDGVTRIKWNVNSLSDVPSLILIDEISQFTTSDLDLLEKSARKHGFEVVTLGDFDQSKRSIEINGDDNTNMIFTLSRNSFIRSPKIGVSMRTNNSQKNQNQNTLINAILNKSSNINLHYYEDENGLNGDFYMESFNSDLLDSKIDLMIKTLNSDEKIGFIYHDTSSGIYKHITSKYGDKIELYKDNKAQGKEGQYYIAELNGSDPLFLNNLYTAITRSSKGSVIIGSAPISIVSERDLTTVKDEISESAINKFRTKTIEILNQLNLNGKEIKINYPEKEEVKTQKQSSLPETTVIPPQQKQVTITKQTQEPTQNTNYSEFTPKDISIVDVNGIKRPIELSNIQFKDENGLDDTFKILKLDDRYIVLANVLGLEIPYIYENTKWIPFFGFDKKGQIITLNNDIKVLEEISSKLKTAIDIDNLGKIPNSTQETINYINKFYDSIDDINSTESKTIKDRIFNNILTFLDYELNNKEPEIIPFLNQPTESSYKKMLDDANKDNPVNVKESHKTGSNGKKFLDILWYSFNTFESGIDFNGNDNDIITKNNINPNRIDSINGLVQILGETYSYKNLMEILGNIRSILLSSNNKSEILDYLSNVLNKQNLYLNFGIKTIVDPKAHIDQAQSGRFAKGPNEKSHYIYSEDLASSELSRTNLVAIIGDKSGDLLELPLLSFSNPISIAFMKDDAGNYIHPQYANIFSNNDGKNLHEKMNEFIQFLKNNGQENSDLYYLSKLFNVTSNNIFYLDKENFLPAKSFKQLGPMLILKKGESQFEKNLQYEAQWITLDEFAKNTAFKSTKILSSNTGIVNNKQIVKPGHPFILVSNDKSIPNLIDYFIQQETETNLPKKVKLIYVVPPKIPLIEYIQSKYDYIYGKKSAKEILPAGQITTSYEILKNIYDNPQFKNEFINLYGDTRYKYISDNISKLKDLEEIDKNQFIQFLIGEQDWTNVNIGNYKLHQLFDRSLVSFVYPEIINRQPNQDIFKGENFELIKNILEQKNTGFDGVYLRAIKPIEDKTQRSHNVIFEIIQDNDSYTYQGLPFLLHGKIDSAAFYGNLGYFLQNIFKYKLRMTNNNIPFSLDNNRYRNGQSKIKTRSKKVSVNELIQKVDDINSQPNSNQISFIDNDELLITKPNSILLENKIVSLFDSNNNQIKVLPKSIDGISRFVLETTDVKTGQKIKYSAEFKKDGIEKILELTEIREVKQENNITPIDTTKELRELFEKNNSDGDIIETIEDVSMLHYNNAEEAIKDIDIIIDSLDPIDEWEVNSKGYNLIKDLLEFQKKTKKENIDDDCPITITLKF